MSSRGFDYEMLGDPTKVAFDWLPGGNKRLTLPESLRVVALLSRTATPKEWGGVSSAEGRNLIVRGADPLEIDYRAEAGRTHIQLSGGFYLPLEIIGNGVAITPGQSILLPAPENFVIGREMAQTTSFVDELGGVQTVTKTYAPTGGYTQEQALRKMDNTVRVGAINDRVRFLASHGIVVPEILGSYSFPDIPDETGVPIHGIAMLVPPPEARYGYRISQFLRSELSAPIIDLDRFVIEYCQQMFPYVIEISNAARLLHDKFHLFHGQLTLGNCGDVPQNRLYPRAGKRPYIADWDSMRDLSIKTEANELARALELCVVWGSAYSNFKFVTNCAPRELIDDNERRILYKIIGRKLLTTLFVGYGSLNQESFDYPSEPEAEQFMNSNGPEEFARNMLSMMRKCL